MPHRLLWRFIVRGTQLDPTPTDPYYIPGMYCNLPQLLH